MFNKQLRKLKEQRARDRNDFRCTFGNIWDINHIWMNLIPSLTKICYYIKFDFAKEIGIKMCEEVYGDTNGINRRLLLSLTINDNHMPGIEIDIIRFNTQTYIDFDKRHFWHYYSLFRVNFCLIFILMRCDQTVEQSNSSVLLDITVVQIWSSPCSKVIDFSSLFCDFATQ